MKKLRKWLEYIYIYIYAISTNQERRKCYNFFLASNNEVAL